MGEVPPPPPPPPQAGTGVNIVPESATCQVDRRVVDVEDISEISRSMEKMCHDAAMATGECVSFEAVKTASVAPFLVPSDNDFVVQMEGLSGNQSGIVGFGTNASQVTVIVVVLRSMCPLTHLRLHITIIEADIHSPTQSHTYSLI